MPEPTDMIVPLLREMRDETRRSFADLRADLDRRFEGVDSRFDAVDARLRAIEKIVKAQREAFEGESILGRYAAKEVEERLAPLERKVEALEGKS
ncbi:hypothetical protein GJ689_08765 [Rhodoplanes serenus]|uniref:Uncharacterized protein n=1 Tax=Rhodoplanes serenus TaxID=200615 RepID=A0A9X4XPT5_9BRAD|nr:hypothetical protein [Rhodoplanes serenus]MTW16301.1 hypothetical protein [Rhodoplanes serenus]